jgi:hypothetical protein
MQMLRSNMFGRGGIIMTRIRLIVVLMAVIVLIPLLAFSQVQAATNITVNLSAKTDALKAGDTIALSVRFNCFPNLTRFGPVEVQFDPKYVSFAGMDKGKSMPSTFSISNTASTNVISIIGVDQTIEGILSSNQTAPLTDANGNALPKPQDPSMFSDSSVTVCLLYFKVIDTAPTGEANFWLGGIGGFRDSSFAALAATAGNTVIIPVQSTLSSEATLASLSIKGSTLTPAFSPSVFSYETHVSRSVTAADITATAQDPTAQVMITGNDNLVVGDNPVTVKVSAQDGKTAIEYKINIIRDANYVPAGASITGSDGTVYTFAELPQPLDLPSGFSQQMEVVGAQSVPVFTGNGYKSMLLYLKDGKKDPPMYIYNPDTGSIRLYEADHVINIAAQLLTVTDVPADVTVPNGFFKADITLGDMQETGYISSQSDVTLVYLTDEKGAGRFYEIDSSTGDLFPYKEVKTDSGKTSFLLPLVLVSVLSVAEFAMIVYIIYQVRSKNRPQEVKRV